MRYRLQTKDLNSEKVSQINCNACEAHQQEREGVMCPEHRGLMSCFDCGDYMVWNKRYNAWECDNCEMYVEDDRDAFNFISSDYN